MLHMLLYMAINACFKRIVHLFQTYVASVSSGCFKSRSGRAYVAMALVVVDSGLPQPPAAVGGTVVGHRAGP
jgi:hypothetical protein